ncbi:hypothetical protein BOX15_Mlig025031g3, partial [Macrostomum lignano]
NRFSAIVVVKPLKIAMTSWDEKVGGEPADYGNAVLSANGSYTILPEPVKTFLCNFEAAIRNRNVYDIIQCYEAQFPKLTERFFAKYNWPATQVVTEIVSRSLGGKEPDQLFVILYTEMYYKHIYAHIAGGPSFEDREASYFNYCDFFNFVLGTDTPVTHELPYQLLWDIIDEFIYQFQNFTQYRAKLKNKKDEEISTLRDSVTTWNIHSVLNVLHSLVEKSCINEQLRELASGGDISAVAGEFGERQLYKMLGFFSLIGLCRLHCILGDFFQALKVLENIDVSRLDLYCNVPTCNITTSYYVGFSFMMMRRYEDAIRTLNDALAYHNRVKSSLAGRPDVADYVAKQTDQMCHLLCLCLSLHPMRVDEIVHAQIKEKYNEKNLKLSRMDLDEIANTFQYACPKFLSPVPPNFDLPENYQMNPMRQIKEEFISEIKQQARIPDIRSYLKLYTTLSIEKLAGLMNTEPQVLHRELMCYKHKMQNIVTADAAAAAAAEAPTASSSELDFYIDGDMIHVADTKVARKFGELFIRNILKLEDVNRALTRLDQFIYGVAAGEAGPQAGSARS